MNEKVKKGFGYAKIGVMAAGLLVALAMFGAVVGKGANVAEKVAAGVFGACSAAVYGYLVGARIKEIVDELKK